jgi:drug/metabolite transporter (DMT)-like permease
MTNTLKAIFLIMAAMAAFTALDTCAKLVTQSLEAWVAVFFRYVLASLLSFPILFARHGGAGLQTRHPWLQATRGFLLMGSTICNFTAMKHLQLAQTAAIFFTIPLFVSVLSVPLLCEQVGIRRWLAVLAGFCGVLAIMRPGLGGFHWAMLFSLAASLQGALYNIATRKVGGQDSVETSLFYVCLLGALGAALPAAFHWQWPQGAQWLLLVGMGLAGTIGHFMLIEAHRLATAARIAPFIYTQILWMSLAGYLVFEDVPDIWTLLGAAIVVASGLYLFNRERINGRLGTVAAPTD